GANNQSLNCNPFIIFYRWSVAIIIQKRDFLKTLRTFSTFYGGLADQMCLQELSSGDGLPCWNGTNIVKRIHLSAVGAYRHVSGKWMAVNWSTHTRASFMVSVSGLVFITSQLSILLALSSLKDPYTYPWLGVVLFTCQLLLKEQKQQVG
ncbi:hypothetical protein XENOCAPTIV_007789, partial [Xenoophorus captivus]